MRNIFKKSLIVFAVIFSVAFINGCVFMFAGKGNSPMMKATEKVLAGKGMNAYETISAWTMNVGTWMLTWPVSPETAKMTFCKTFHLPLNYLRFPKCWEEDETVRNCIKALAYEGQRKQITYKNYYINPRVSVALNGAWVECEKKTDDFVTVRYIIPTDYHPGIPEIKGIKISETLLDYLENRGILSNPVYHYTKTYKISEL